MASGRRGGQPGRLPKAQSLGPFLSPEPHRRLAHRGARV